MFRQIDVWAMSHDLHLYLVESDATRLIAKMEPVVIAPTTNFMVGASFPPDPRFHPRVKQMPPIKTRFEDLQKEIDALTASNNVAVNVMLYGIKCSTDPFRPLTFINAYPCARSNNTLLYQIMEWTFCIYFTAHFEDGTVRPRQFRPALMSASTDSCGVELGGGLYLMPPNKAEIKQG